MPENQDQSPKQGKSQMPPYPPQYRRRRSGSNWWIPVVILVAVIVLIVFLFFAFFGAIGSMFEEKEVEVTENSVLHLKLQNVQEYKRSDPFAAFTGGAQASSLLDIVSAIERAKDDNHIKGIYLQPALQGPGFVKSQEIIKSLNEFKESGKFIYSYLELGNESHYFNCLPSDSIFVPVEGMIEFNGYSSTNLFFGDLFKKLGVNFHVERFEDFKSAAETLNRTGYTDSAKYQIRVLLKQRANTLIDSVSKHRNIPRETVSSHLEKGIYTADTLLLNGLADVHMTELELKEFMKKKLFGNNDEDKDVNLIRPSDYLRSDPPMNKKVYDSDTQIAIIYGSGAIVSSGNDEYSSEYQIKSKQFVKYLKEAREDDKIKAIILRIDSPGGSVLASDEIWNEINKTKAAKPVYASMSDVAASGGYYMAMACDTIIASPNTITGSIGVIAAMANLSETTKKLHTHVDTVSVNKNANFLNPLLPFEQKDQKRFHKIVEAMYNRFVGKVAESRGMTFEETRKLARGRVWTGNDAYEHGLVDIVGDFETAIKLAKKKAGVPDSMSVLVSTYPKPMDNIKALLKMLGFDSEMQNYNSSNSKVDIAKQLGIDPVSAVQSWDMLPPEARKQMKYLIELAEMSNREKVLMAMPYLPAIK